MGKIICSLIILLIALPSYAQDKNLSDSMNKTPIAAPECSEPKRPEMFQNQQQIQDYKQLIEEYQKCLTLYIKQQNDNADKYQKMATDYREAANNAAKQWNDFVRKDSQPNSPQ